jgi:hypothetical protein
LIPILQRERRQKPWQAELAVEWSGVPARTVEMAEGPTPTAGAHMAASDDEEEEGLSLLPSSRSSISYPRRDCELEICVGR